VSSTVETNFTGFYDFDTPDPTLTKEYYGFRRDNEFNLKHIMENKGKPGKKYPVNDHKELIEFYPGQTLLNVQIPSMDWATRKLGLPAVKMSQM